ELGVQPELGRYYTPEEDREGGAPVVVISHDAWQKYLKGTPDVIDSTMVINGHNVTVVGVMPPGFVFPATWRRTDYWVPIRPTLDAEAVQRGQQSFKCVARLRDGATVG